jgi:hypothetical protein
VNISSWVHRNKISLGLYDVDQMDESCHCELLEDKQGYRVMREWNQQRSS